MCSAAQILESFFQFETKEIPPDVAPGAGFQQEYALPIDIDQILSMSYFSGTIFPILPAPQSAVQIGGHVGGIPWYFYIKRFTRTLTPQVNGGELISMPIAGENAAEARTVIGLYPVPANRIPIYVKYLAFHPQLKRPFDEVQFPDMFKLGWIAYAVARCLEKKGGAALQEAGRWDGVHDRETEKLCVYVQENSQMISPPTYSNNHVPPYFLRGANTVLVVSQNPTFSNI